MPVAERLDVIFFAANIQWSSRIRYLDLPAGLGFLLLIHRQDTKQQFAEAQSLGALQNSIIPLQLILTLTIPSNPASFPLISYSLLRDIQPQLARIQDTIQDKQQSFAAMAHELPYAVVFLAITAKASGRHIATQDLGSASPTA